MKQVKERFNCQIFLSTHSENYSVNMREQAIKEKGPATYNAGPFEV